MKKTILQRTAALFLCFALAAEMFVKTGITAEAGDTYDVCNLRQGGTLKSGDILKQSGNSIVLYYYRNATEYDNRLDEMYEQDVYSPDPAIVGEGITEKAYQNREWEIAYYSLVSANHYNLHLIACAVPTPTPTPAPTPTVIGGGDEQTVTPVVRDTQPKRKTVEEDVSEQQDAVSYVPPHEHSYAWVEGSDGVEEYRCSCGDVQGRNEIPAGTAYVEELCGMVRNAPQGGTVQYDSGWLCTMSDDMIGKLAERTDVTTIITFEYQHKSYRMTIPAGADYTELLGDEEMFYGYFYLAQAVGAVIEEL